MVPCAMLTRTQGRTNTTPTIVSAVAIAAGVPTLDPLIGLGMTVMILRITRESWHTVRGHSHHQHHH